MGQKLIEFYTEAEKLGGFQAKVKLAMLSGLTSTQAQTEEDSPAHLKKVEEALNQLKKELGSASSGAATSSVSSLNKIDILKQGHSGESSKDAETRLRKHIKAYLDLMGQRSLFLGQVDKTLARITETIVHTLDVARASIWFYDDARTQITSSDLFERANGKHSSGVVLQAKDFPNYFKSLQTERTIAAHDAHTDPRTSEFSEVYLKPLGINSMLDVPIWLKGKMVGVVCHEHVGPQRHWIADEENFAFLMANFVALALENKK